MTNSRCSPPPGLPGSARRRSAEARRVSAAVAPGLTRTAHAEANVPESHFAAVLAGQAVKRSGQPEDSASAVAYLASTEAAFVTGQTLLVDGGEGFT